MSEKRRTRYGGEPPPKRRQSPSPPASTPTKVYAHRSAPRQVSKAPPLPPPEPVEESLPTRLRDGQTLPTLPTLQDSALLSDKEYQSVSESGVLKASLEQSRLKWLTDSVFEKYWVKPSKKKGNTPILGAEMSNPPIKSMSKLGPCSLIIEPHVFDCTLYLARDPSGAGYQNPGAGQTPPPATVFDAFAKPSHNTQGMQSSGLPRYSASKGGGQRSPSQLSLPPFREGFGSMGPQQPAQNLNSSASSQPNVSNSMPSPAYNTKSANGATEPSQHPNPSAPAPAKPNGDPVIQMLAARAASDRELKSLMKVVAAATATPEQMKIFQDLIDELNDIIRKQDAECNDAPGVMKSAWEAPATGGQTTSNMPKHKVTYEGNTSQQRRNSQPSSSNRAGSTNHPPPTSIKPELTHANVPQTPPAFYTPSYPYTANLTTGARPTYPPFHPPPRPQQQQSLGPPSQQQLQQPPSVLIEFHGPSSLPIRYLLPRLSILEILPTGHQAILSFLAIIPDPDLKTTPKKDKDKGSKRKTYQPITIRLSAAQPRILEPLRRAVAPLPEVRKWMEGIFSGQEETPTREGGKTTTTAIMKRAESRWLAVRLPRGDEKSSLSSSDVGHAAEKHRAGMPILSKTKKVNGGHDELDEEMKENWEWEGVGMAPLLKV